ncbi:MAG TPA: phosphatidate cytidylyltransferase [Bacteroidetes bacterium]|nr:phosphatidate cytidylyltransferase [Bacteroidota bacterium]
MDKKILVTRTLTGIVFGIIMLGGLLGNQTSFMILITVICGGCLWEYYGMVSVIQTYPREQKIQYRITFTLVGMMTYLLFLVVSNDIFLVGYAVITIPILFLLLAMEMFAGETRHFQNGAVSFLGIFYISVPLGLLHLMIFLGSRPGAQWYPDKIAPVLGLILLIWANDTFAYLIGSLIGKHKMFPSISPKKSWEGFAGGVIFSFAAAWIISLWLKTLSLENWMVITAIASVIGTTGDLFESMIKRNLGIKDSGNFLPGHGGFLDRFDAFIFCIPFVFAYLMLK